MKKNNSKTDNRYAKICFLDYFSGMDYLVGVGVLFFSIPIVVYINFPNIFMEYPVLQVILNLSYSFLAASIFYLLQIFLPKVASMKRAVRSLSRCIVSLYEEIAFANSFLSMFINVRNDDLVDIKYFDDGFVYYKYSDGEFKSDEFKNILIYMKDFHSNINSSLKKIHSSRLYDNLPIELINKLEDLRLVKFSMIEAIGDSYPACHRYGSINKDLNQLKEYECIISNFIANNTEITIVPMTQKEKNDYKKKIKNLRPSLELFHNELKATLKMRSKNNPTEL